LFARKLRIILAPDRKRRHFFVGRFRAIGQLSFAATMMARRPLDQNTKAQEQAESSRRRLPLGVPGQV